MPDREVNATDEIRRRAEWNTEHTLPRLAVCWAWGDFAVVDGELYAIGATWTVPRDDGTVGTWVGLVPPSGETPEENAE